MSESGVGALRALISLTRGRNNPNRPNKNSRRAAGDERSWLGGELNRPPLPHVAGLGPASPI